MTTATLYIDDLDPHQPVQQHQRTIFVAHSDGSTETLRGFASKAEQLALCKARGWRVV